MNIFLLDFLNPKIFIKLFCANRVRIVPTWLWHKINFWWFPRLNITLQQVPSTCPPDFSDPIRLSFAPDLALFLTVASWSDHSPLQFHLLNFCLWVTLSRPSINFTMTQVKTNPSHKRMVPVFLLSYFSMAVALNRGNWCFKVYDLVMQEWCCS